MYNHLVHCTYMGCGQDNPSSFILFTSPFLPLSNLFLTVTKHMHTFILAMKSPCFCLLSSGGVWKQWCSTCHHILPGYQGRTSFPKCVPDERYTPDVLIRTFKLMGWLQWSIAVWMVHRFGLLLQMLFTLVALYCFYTLQYSSMWSYFALHAYTSCGSIVDEWGLCFKIWY